MTEVRAEAPAARTDSRARQVLTVVIAATLACAAILLTSGDSWLWPFQYGDDLILDVPTWSYYDEKLPGEARWIVWLWHELFGGQSAAADFRGALVAWCVSMALVAQRLTNGARWTTVVCAVALSANPAVLQLLQWPHTALPMMVTMLAGVTLLDVSNATVRRTAIALAVSTFAAMLAFQLFALLLIAAALLTVTAQSLRARPWNARELLRDATTVVVWGAAGTICGLLASFALNEAAFGHFGLDIAGWRGANAESGSRATLAAANWRDVMLAASDSSAHLIWPVTLVATAVWSVLAVRAQANTPVVWLVVVILIGVMLAPLSVALVSGTPVPATRGGLTIWFAAIVTLILLADVASRRFRVGVIAAMAALTAITVWLTGAERAALSRIRVSHDVHLAFIARDVRAVLRETASARTLVAIGTRHPFEQLDGNDEWWVRGLLRTRFEPAVAGSVIYCASTSCEALRAQSMPDMLSTMPAYPNEGYVRRVGDLVLVNFGSATPTSPATAP